MAMNVGGQQDHLMGEINVTPFVDVMLVLLIIFMVTAPLIQQQVDVELPETRSRKSVAVKENDVVLTINKKRQIFLAKNRVRLKNLTAKLKAIYHNKEKKVIYLQADKSVRYGFVVKVMALVKNAGIEQMGMITQSEK